MGLLILLPQDEQCVFGNTVRLKTDAQSRRVCETFWSLIRAPGLVIIGHLSLSQPITSPPHCVVYGCFLSLLQIWWLIISGPVLTEPFNTLLHSSPLVLLHRKLEKLTLARAKGADLYCAYKPGSYSLSWDPPRELAASVCSLQTTGGVYLRPYMGMWVCRAVSK